MWLSPGASGREGAAPADRRRGQHRRAGTDRGRWSAAGGTPGRVLPNVTFVGRLDRAGLCDFYRQARFTVVPSIWFEVCPLVISEAMSYGLPVIASRIGGLPELVDEGVTGLLMERGDAHDLAVKMKTLWDNPELCRSMGVPGEGVREYSEDVYYARLMTIYQVPIARADRPAPNRCAFDHLAKTPARPWPPTARLRCPA